jgi:hypothetical protein
MPLGCNAGAECFSSQLLKKLPSVLSESDELVVVIGEALCSARDETDELDEWPFTGC